ncbi:MAG: beta strand repeat-containing protein, partial [Bacteroidota bacterium]
GERGDLLDGENAFHLPNSWTSKNDYFTYGAVKFLFSFGSGGGNTSNTTSNHNNYTVTNNLPPDVRIISPSQNSFASTFNPLQVYATVSNVSDQSGVTVTVNGTPFYGFTFTPGSGAISFSSSLQNGNNVIVITGTNQYGTDSEVLNVSYTPANSGTPPIVNITSPVNNLSTQNSVVNVSAFVQNVTQFNQVQVSLNGNSITNFLFNSSNGNVNFMANLNQGNNTITVSGTNQYGTDIKTINIYLSSGFSTIPAPIVTILNPPNPGFTTTSSSFNFMANITGVTSSSQIAVKINGNNTSNFSFNSTNGALTLPSNLSPGSTSISITATNNSGSDTKSSNVIFIQSGSPPVVTFLNPSSANYISNAASISVQAQVTNVSSSNDIQVYVNNSVVSNFTFNTITKFLTLPLTLSTSITSVTIVGSNAFGSDTKSIIINYLMPSISKPTVTITNPPYAGYQSTSSNFVLNATVSGVNSVNQIAVTVNGVNNSSFAFNSSTGSISLPLVLSSGSTYFTVSASNTSGFDTKSSNVIYSPVVSGNPPIITLINPNSSTASVGNTNFSFKAQVLNVSGANDISLTLNNQLVTNFSYNVNTKILDCNLPLTNTSNPVTITAVNSFGLDNKSCTINYQTINVSPPIINVINPPYTPFASSLSNFNLSATVLNCQNSNQITLTQNGSTVSSFTFNPSTQSLSAPLIL